MTRLDVFLKQECIISDSMKCGLTELWTVYKPYTIQKELRGPISINV